MDALNHNISHNKVKSNKLNSIVCDPTEKQINVHGNETTHNVISYRNRDSSNSSSRNNNSTQANVSNEDVQRNGKSNSCSKTYIANFSHSNAKDHSSRMGIKTDQMQKPFDQNGTKTNGYVNGHSDNIVENFQNYRKPNR